MHVLKANLQLQVSIESLGGYPQQIKEDTSSNVIEFLQSGTIDQFASKEVFEI